MKTLYANYMIATPSHYWYFTLTHEPIIQVYPKLILDVHTHNMLHL
jgi:hypothetical protein